MALTPSDVPACGAELRAATRKGFKKDESNFEDTARLFKELGRA
jgi:hypothetical protein